MKLIYKKIALVSCLTTFFCAGVQAAPETCPHEIDFAFSGPAGWHTHDGVVVSGSLAKTTLKDKKSVACSYEWNRNGLLYSVHGSIRSTGVTLTKECKHVTQANGRWEHGMLGLECKGNDCKFVCDNSGSRPGSPKH